MVLEGTLVELLETKGTHFLLLLWKYHWQGFGYHILKFAIQNQIASARTVRGPVFKKRRERVGIRKLNFKKFGSRELNFEKFREWAGTVPSIFGSDVTQNQLGGRKWFQNVSLLGWSMIASNENSWYVFSFSANLNVFNRWPAVTIIPFLSLLKRLLTPNRDKTEIL